MDDSLHRSSPSSLLYRLAPQISSKTSISVERLLWQTVGVDAQSLSKLTAFSFVDLCISGSGVMVGRSSAHLPNLDCRIHSAQNKPDERQLSRHHRVCHHSRCDDPQIHKLEAPIRARGLLGPARLSPGAHGMSGIPTSVDL